MKESAILQSSFMRSSEVAGAMSGIYERLQVTQVSAAQIRAMEAKSHPPLVQKFLNLKASSGGKSTTIKPLTPASLASFSMRSSP